MLRLARYVWSVTTLSLSSPVIDVFDALPARARCVVCVSTSSLSSFVIGVFDTMPRSRTLCGLYYHVIAIVACH